MLDSAFSLLPIPTLLVDADGRIQAVSDPAVRLLSPAGELAGRPVGEVVPELGAALSRCGSNGWREFSAGIEVAGEPYHALLRRVEGKSGSGTLVTLEAPDAAVQGTDSAALRRLLTALPAIVWTTDRDLQITAAAGSPIRRLEADTHQSVGKNLLDYLAEDKDAPTLAAIRRSLEGHSTVIENRWRGRHFHVHSEPLRNEAGHIIGTVGMAIDLTSRHREEDEIRRSRDYAETLIRTASLMAVSLDPEGRIRVFNEAAEQLTGYLHDEVVGQNWFELIVPRDRYPEAWDEFQKLQRGGASASIETPILTKSGDERLICWSSSTLRRDDGALEVVSFGMDMTEQRRMEAELRASEERNRTLLACLPQRIFFKSYDGVFVSVNGPFAADFGMTPQEFQGKSDADFFPEELAAKYRADDLRIMHSRMTEEIVETNIVNGVPRVVEVVKTPVIGEDGRIEGVLGIFTDITDRKRMEDALHHERHLLQTLMENIPDLIYFKDAQSRFTRGNRAQAVALGASSPDELVGKTDAAFFPPEFADVYLHDERRILHSGEALINKQETVRLPDGEVRWLLSTKVPVVGPDGNVTGLVGVGRDVTEQVRQQEELHRTAAELQRSNEELEQFAYVASHDLQEPLRMVASYTQLLQRRYKDKLDDDAHEFIQYAVDGATRMQGLIQDLLAYSRVGTRGKAPEPTSMEECLARALQNLQIAIEEQGATITHDPLPVVNGDPLQLVQLLQNLVGNAIKFRAEEPPQVHISAQHEGSDWHFTVRDNGIGIDPEYAERIFVIFQRLHGKSEYPGSGIGLSICKKIVNRHGGRIWVESHAGEGSCFHFTLPAVESGKRNGGPRPPEKQTVQ